MFNWFSKPDYINGVKFPESPLPTRINQAAKDDSDAPVYQVGKTNDGRITLRLGTDYSFTTIIMTSDAVDTLIRMLVAAKECEFSEDEDVNAND
jgi:hypothetical protein